MDSKWGVPLVAALAGAGIFLFTRSSTLVKEARYGRDPLKAGWPKTESPQPLLSILHESQLAQREYYLFYIHYLTTHLNLVSGDPEVVAAQDRFEIYNKMCEDAGVLDSQEYKKPILGMNVKMLKPQYRLKTNKDWKARKFSDVGGPLNPMEIHLGMGKTRIHTQSMIGEMKPRHPEEWKQMLREWEKGTFKAKYPKEYANLLSNDPRIEFRDFDMFANAKELYFFQFTLAGLTILRRWGVKMPYDFLKCYQFMSDFLFTEAYLGGWMETRAIDELMRHPDWPSDWKIAKTHTDLDNRGADLIVYNPVIKKKINNKWNRQKGIVGQSYEVPTDVIGLIQVKPYSFIAQNQMQKKNDPNENVRLDKLRHQARSFWDKTFKNNWNKWKDGQPIVGREEDEYKTDAQGNIIYRTYVDVDGFTKRIPDTKGITQRANPSRGKFHLQLMVYEKDKQGSAHEWLNHKGLNRPSAIIQRLKDNTIDPVLEGYEQKGLDWWDEIKSPKTFLNQ